jgi:hypothetical protein
MGYRAPSHSTSVSLRYLSATFLRPSVHVALFRSDGCADTPLHLYPLVTSCPNVSSVTCQVSWNEYGESIAWSEHKEQAVRTSSSYTPPLSQLKILPPPLIHESPLPPIQTIHFFRSPSFLSASPGLGTKRRRVKSVGSMVSSSAGWAAKVERLGGGARRR